MHYKRYISALIALLLLMTVSVYATDAEDLISTEHIFTNSELACETDAIIQTPASSNDGMIRINHIEGEDTRDSITYYIAMVSNGDLLSSPTSGSFSRTRYSSGVNNGHVTQKWIFTQVSGSTSTFIVYSNTDTSKCLTVNPSTKAVTLSAYTGSQYQKWSMYYSSSGNSLVSEATDTSIHGCKLVVGTNTCSVSNQSFTPMGFLNVSWYVPCSILSIRDIGVPLGGTATMYTPDYSPSNSNCNGNMWENYTSNNSSACPINSSGVLTGNALSSVSITVTNKITGTFGIFTADVLVPVTKNARIYYDSGVTQSASTLASIYGQATADLSKAYCINMNLVSTSLSTQLNGNSCPNTTPNHICTASCGTLTSCATTHHKSAARLVDLLSSSSYYTYRLVSHAVCTYDGTHNEIVGLGYRPGRDAITSVLTTPELKTSIQHELTHNLGGSHYTCINGQKSVLKGNFDYWCDNCRSAILQNRN